MYIGIFIGILTLLWIAITTLGRYLRSPEPCPMCKLPMVAGDPSDLSFYWCENPQCVYGQHNLADALTAFYEAFPGDPLDYSVEEYEHYRDTARN